METEFTLIIGRSYSQSMTWLRRNRKKYNLDPQKVRIVTNAEALKGFKNYTVIWLRGWTASIESNRIRAEAALARSAGRISKELAD